ncbi:MAG: hypothetical protein M1823_001151 [Watsoniomyces obsoletus]|nr:MAG: hypothetical protein M1823_001151 [Watsoniomyces obsoletus]
MAPRPEKSHLKRGPVSTEEAIPETKKPRRSQRIQSQSQLNPIDKQSQLPSPLTHAVSTATEDWKEPTISPPEGRPSQFQPRSPITSPKAAGLSSPPNDTQALSQFVYPPSDLAPEVKDEEAEGVWGYLVPLDNRFGDTLVLRRRATCPKEVTTSEAKKGKRNKGKGKGAVAAQSRKVETSEKEQGNSLATGGYLIGRHPECDRVIELPTISNRHCLIFPENAHGESIAMLEDLSSNGTFVNDAIIGRNKRRELRDADEIMVADEARFTFRYPRSHRGSGFRQQYTLLQQLGKGHFATVYLCIEKATGQRFAVKIFHRRPGVDERSKNEGLQQEIAVLMAVSHPNMLCLKDTFDEGDGVYLVLELAPEGELFNLIITKSKLTEDEARKVFLQLFQGVKYLHDRNIVHRDIKPENILLVDKNLTVKLADFGLAKIIGEQSFTTTLCGTPSYVAPEILENSSQRMYTRAVDVWSLGVVLYICLCGFPPFSDELYNDENPYTLSQQIKLGRFDYPSPYWDSIGDPALDLIDRMLTVDVDKRISIDECLEHPWITQGRVELNDSTDGLTGAMGQLDFSKRKIHRERTLLSSLNDITVNEIHDPRPDKQPVKVFEKKPTKLAAPLAAQNGAHRVDFGLARREGTPGTDRDPREFMQMGGKGDEPLFDDEGSAYVPDSALHAAQPAA